MKYENFAKLEETEPSVKIKAKSGNFDDMKSSNKELMRKKGRQER